MVQQKLKIDIITYLAKIKKINYYFFFIFKATPIYLLVLRAQEVGNEPFWNKKKVKKCNFFIFLESAD